MLQHTVRRTRPCGLSGGCPRLGAVKCSALLAQIEAFHSTERQREVEIIMGSMEIRTVS